MIEQRSDAWFEVRRGKVTASKIADVMAKGQGKSRENYMLKLIAEITTGMSLDTYKSPAMQWGDDTEDLARRTYEIETLTQVDKAPFFIHPRILQSGASPDGLVSDTGLIEIKCQNTQTHLNTILTKKIPRKYLYQMQWQLACTQRAWVDFVSFDPRTPDKQQLLVQRIHRDDELIKTLEDGVETFIAEMQDAISLLGHPTLGPTMKDEKLGSFTLQKNTKKTQDKHPDYRGQGIDLGGQKVWLSGWIRHGQYGSFISLAMQPRVEKMQVASPAPELDDAPDDIPF